MKTPICFICPNSCNLSIEESGDGFAVTGNQCERGVKFAGKEMTDPERMLTSTVRVLGGELPLVSVRSDGLVKKGEIKSLVHELDSLVVKAPIIVGQILKTNIGVNKVNIIATRNVGKRA